MSVPSQAIVLCAGEGRRLRPYTEVCPKPLLPLLNVPLVQHALAALQRAGVRRAALNAWHHADQIVAFAATDPVPGLSLHVRVEPELLGTGGGLANLRDWLEPGPLLLLAGDIVADFDFAALCARHACGSAEATMALVDGDVAHYGAVELDGDGRITDVAGLLGRPGRTAHVNASAHVLEPAFVARLPGGPCCLVRQGYVPALAAGARCAGWLHAGPWAELGAPEALLAAQAAALSGALPVHGELLRQGGRRYGDRALVHPTARIAPEVTLSEGSVVGARAIVGRGAVLRGCLVLPDARVPDGASWQRRIVAPEAAAERVA